MAAQDPAVPEPEPEPAPQPEPGQPPYSATEFPVPVAPGRYRTLANPAPSQPEAEPQPEYPAAPDPGDEPINIPDGVPREEFYFSAYRQYVASHGQFPTARQLARALNEGHGITTADGSLLSETYLGGYMREFKDRYNTEMGLAG
ncbi:hypothetical protein ITI46_32445 [Streptomyces oryzae]|uniref:Uncharacterized protein n=1 Tax=Streptomyces oryzae TaxID=1434886 RepID=A0ABS3XLP9_9ACTN|nr:hypothetical protein [Streptomyces oryzae]